MISLLDQKEPRSRGEALEPRDFLMTHYLNLTLFTIRAILLVMHSKCSVSCCVSLHNGKNW